MSKDQEVRLYIWLGPGFQMAIKRQTYKKHFLITSDTTRFTGSVVRNGYDHAVFSIR